MENVGMFYVMIVWPAFVGWYGAARGLRLVEVIVIGLLPVMMFAAIK